MESNSLHVAIVLDGNRRYAKKHSLKFLWNGHDKGAETVEQLLDWCKELNINQLTLYCLSTENLKREKDEVNALLSLFKKKFLEFENDKRIKEDRVKIRFIGNLSLLPSDIQEICKRIENNTKENNNYIINFCLAYGGKEEIIQAVKKIAEQAKNSKIKIENINEKTINQALYISDQPDLIIRTGGFKRTSNFLPFQSAYSEWFFSDKLWPEFTKQDLIECIEQFKKTKRNFGK